MIKIVIVDDHIMVRKGLRLLLEQQADMEIVGEGNDGEQAIYLTRQFQPDVLLLDLLMPHIGGITVIQKIKEFNSKTSIIVLTSSYDEEHIYQSIKVGALSYLLKDSSPDTLISSIRAAVQGESSLPSQIATKLLREIKRNRPQIDNLTARELDVLKLIAHGYSNQMIAGKLDITERTVKTHVSSILSKLRLTDRTQAAIYALQHRLVALDDILSPEKLLE